jgi:hypothetical protein
MAKLICYDVEINKAIRTHPKGRVNVYCKADEKSGWNLGDGSKKQFQLDLAVLSVRIGTVAKPED